MHIAYLVSRFPLITETFILREMLSLIETGIDIRVFPLMVEKAAMRHPETERILPRVFGLRPVSRETLGAHLSWLVREPLRYLGAWGAVLAGNIASPGFLVRAVVVMWKAAAWARGMRDAGIDHVHAHWATHPALAAFIIRRLTGIPYSITAHAHDIQIDRTMLKRKILESRFTVTISEFNRRRLAALYGEEVERKIRVVRLGVDLEAFEPPPERPSPPPFRILCVAAFKPYKGHRYLIEACSLLRDRGIPFECCCIGDGPELAAAAAQIRSARLERHIRLCGARFWYDVRQHLARSHCMVLPSIVARGGKTEGIPVALMEAMAMEVPVVATDVSGIPEIVESGRNGLLVSPAAPSAMADAVEKLYRNRELRRALADAGRNTVELEYDLNENVENLRRLLTDEA